jgi:predicted thioesterase
MEDLTPGLRGTASVKVDAQNTAAALGNEGVDVFATPFMVALVEEACRDAVEPRLPAGKVTLGGLVELRHLAPTPEGYGVEARAELVEVKGPKLVFTVEVSDDVETVGKARHVRFVADEGDFQKSVRDKARRRGAE